MSKPRKYPRLSAANDKEGRLIGYRRAVTYTLANENAQEPA